MTIQASSVTPGNLNGMFNQFFSIMRPISERLIDPFFRIAEYWFLRHVCTDRDHVCARGRIIVFPQADVFPPNVYIIRHFSSGRGMPRPYDIRLAEVEANGSLVHSMPCRTNQGDRRSPLQHNYSPASSFNSASSQPSGVEKA